MVEILVTMLIAFTLFMFMALALLGLGKGSPLDNPARSKWFRDQADQPVGPPKHPDA
ncbi:MAG: hypothetical protein AAGF71_03805 [Pseudomonadota bacterium]